MRHSYGTCKTDEKKGGQVESHVGEQDGLLFSCNVMRKSISENGTNQDKRQAFKIDCVCSSKMLSPCGKWHCFQESFLIIYPLTEYQKGKCNAVDEKQYSGRGGSSEVQENGI